MQFEKGDVPLNIALDFIASKNLINWNCVYLSTHTVVLWGMSLSVLLMKRDYCSSVLILEFLRSWLLAGGSSLLLGYRMVEELEQCGLF